jgi:predicted pyridoxine 5'-phosphate oxidase superfamily flavin-nucleotide-binding protein
MTSPPSRLPPGGPDDTSVFHAGEQAVQTRAGMRERLEPVGHKLIRDFMPEQHRELFEALPMLIVGSLDARRRPWASALVGRPGFLRSPDPRTLRVHARPLRGDPLEAQLAVGAPLGLLGIELATRRRNRMNGVVFDATPGAFSVRVQQSFGNCPKYIQARTESWVAAPESFYAPRALEREGRTLSAEATALIRRADTFFIASANPDAATATGDASRGVDVSHRGGRPGFVRVTDASEGTVLTVPDFEGNYLFNTLGNLALDPHAGLLFVDFERGDLLGLTGEVEILWDGPEVDAFAGARRLLRLRIQEGWSVAGALPLRFSRPKPSPHLEGTGRWDEAGATTPAAAATE